MGWKASSGSEVRQIKVTNRARGMTAFFLLAGTLREWESGMKIVVGGGVCPLTYGWVDGNGDLIK